MEDEIRKLAEQIKRDTIESCAKLIDPQEMRPCDCSPCHCGNIGDAEAVAWWDASRHNADLIRGLLHERDRKPCSCGREPGSKRRCYNPDCHQPAEFWFQDETLSNLNALSIRKSP